MTAVAFTAHDYAGRMARAAEQAADAGLTGVMIAPGPDLTYIAGYMPVAITERLTMLVLHTDRNPAMIVPVLERRDAEGAPSAGAVTLTDWADGSDPYAAAAELLDADGRYAVSDAAWAMRVLGLQQTLPCSSYVSMTAALPMLRAVKDEHELERLAAAGAAADASFEGIVQVRFAGRSDRGRRRPRGPAARARALAGRLHRGRLRAHRREPASRGRRADDRGRRHGRARLRRPQRWLRLRHDPHRSRGRAHRRGARGVRDRAGRPAGRIRGRAARRRLPGGRPRGAHRHHRGGLRRAVHPPHRPWDRDHDEEAAIHGRGRDAHSIQPGMCFSIEPGVYLSGRFGVRIEDIATATESGGRRLNNTTHEMQIVA